MKKNNNNQEWNIRLSRTDGKTCRWIIKSTLPDIMDIKENYVRACSCECKWIMIYKDCRIIGKSNINDNGRFVGVAWEINWKRER